MLLYTWSRAWPAAASLIGEPAGVASLVYRQAGPAGVAQLSRRILDVSPMAWRRVAGFTVLAAGPAFAVCRPTGLTAEVTI
ncbi:MAG: hypothetical protein QNL12_03475 [Acidimicrobiia bacterium]|nr:hypothetical protein [Acidimicrobiia bacterium]